MEGAMTDRDKAPVVVGFPVKGPWVVVPVTWLLTMGGGGTAAATGDAAALKYEA